jgi:NNP family nitrate/nitrite transporter-like MFS transporter
MAAWVRPGAGPFSFSAAAKKGESSHEVERRAAHIIMASSRMQTGPVFLLTGIFFLNFMSRIILSPLMPTMESQVGISHTEAGSLFLLTSAGYFLSLLGAGFVSSRLMHRRTIVISAVGVGVTLLTISRVDGFWGIAIGFLALGIAAGLYLPSGIATLTALIRPRDWGKGLGIHELAPNLGFVAAPLVAEGLLARCSWRGVLALVGLASLLAAGAFALFGKGGDFAGEAPSYRSLRQIVGKPPFWIMMALFSLAISGSMGVYAMLPLYLVAERGVDRDWSNTLVALSRLSGLGMGFAAGWMTDRMGPHRIMAAVFLLTGLSTILLGIVPGAWVFVIVFVQPMLAVCFFPAGFAALSSVGPTNSRNLAVSLTVPVAFLIGGGIIPAAIGYMGDSGSFGLGIALAGAMILVGFGLSLALRLPGHVETTK